MRNMAKLRLTAAWSVEEDGVTAWIVEIPNVITQGATVDEALANLKDALDTAIAYQKEKVSQQQGVFTKELEFA